MLTVNISGLCLNQDTSYIIRLGITRRVTCSGSKRLLVGGKKGIRRVKIKFIWSNIQR